MGTTGGIAFVDGAGRVTTGTGLNFRLNPITGGVVDGDANLPGNNPDGAISGLARGVSGTAYTNSFGGATATTQYTLDPGYATLTIGGRTNLYDINLTSGTAINLGPLDLVALTLGDSRGFQFFDTTGDGTPTQPFDLSTSPFIGLPVRGLGGNDNILGTNGNDRINDTITGGEGNDLLRGGRDSDRLDGATIPLSGIGAWAVTCLFSGRGSHPIG